MKAPKLSICDATVHPGETVTLALPLPELYSCAPMYVPIKVVHGIKQGPCIVIIAAMKENELNGVDIINRLMQDNEITQHLCGTMIVVPVLNVYHLTSLSRTLPHELDISKSFPGCENGTFGERIASIFTKEILSKATYCIELKTGGINHEILPQIYCDTENRSLLQLAKEFDAPVITNVATQHYSLRKTADAMNIPLLVYEGGEASRFNKKAIKLGVKGIKNVLRYLHMLESIEHQNERVTTMVSEDQEWARSPKGGILHTDVELGNTVKEGDIIGKIVDPFGAADDVVIKANQSGVIVGINRNPLLYEGQTTIKIASFIDNKRAEKTIEKWEETTPGSDATR